MKARLFQLVKARLLRIATMIGLAGGMLTLSACYGGPYYRLYPSYSYAAPVYPEVLPRPYVAPVPRPYVYGPHRGFDHGPYDHGHFARDEHHERAYR
jgi:hypothetical protein